MENSDTFNPNENTRPVWTGSLCVLSSFECVSWFVSSCGSFFFSLQLTTTARHLKGPYPCAAAATAAPLHCREISSPHNLELQLSNSIYLQRIRTTCWRRGTAVNINFGQQWRWRLESKCMKFLRYLRTSAVMNEQQTQREWMSELLGLSHPSGRIKPAAEQTRLESGRAKTTPTQHRCVPHQQLFVVWLSAALPPHLPLILSAWRWKTERGPSFTWGLWSRPQRSGTPRGRGGGCNRCACAEFASIPLGACPGFCRRILLPLRPLGSDRNSQVRTMHSGS